MEFIDRRRRRRCFWPWKWTAGCCWGRRRNQQPKFEPKDNKKGRRTEIRDNSHENGQRQEMLVDRANGPAKIGRPEVLVTSNEYISFKAATSLTCFGIEEINYNSEFIQGMVNMTSIIIIHIILAGNTYEGFVSAICELDE
jgi:hypothetical protein